MLLARGLLIWSLVCCSFAFAEANRLSDEDFLRTQFKNVFKDNYADDRIQTDLLRELGLLNAEDKKAIENYWNKFYPAPTAEELTKKMSPTLPRPLAERIVAAFRTIHAKGLIFVAVGSTTQYDYDRRYAIGKLAELAGGSRSGVMTPKEYQEIYGDQQGNDAVGYTGTYTLNGTKYELRYDYMDALVYVSLACDYDETAKEWVLKYKKGSPELAAVNEIQRSIQEIYQTDMLYEDAANVRNSFASRIDELVNKAKQQRGDIAGVVRKEISLYNLRLFHYTYKENTDVKRILGEEPTDETLWNFYLANREQFHMVHGHFAPRLSAEINKR